MTTTFSQPDAGWAAAPLQGLAGAIATNVVQRVKYAAAHDPRTLQKMIGPSGLGTPCTRRLAYHLLQWPEVNTDGDPWASTVGKAVHSWMEGAYAAENARLGRERYLIEQRLQIRGNIWGNADLLDREIACNLDWKIVGDTQLKKYRQHGPGPQYEIQQQLYGYGWEQTGEPINDVGIVFIPRTGRIDGLHVWTAPYDRNIALAALERMDNVLTALTHLDPPNNPHTWAMFPASDAYCTFCPWFAPGSTDASKGCPGAA